MTAQNPPVVLRRAGGSDFWRVYVYLRRLGEAEGAHRRLWVDAKTLLQEWFGKFQAEPVFAEVEGRPAGLVVCFPAGDLPDFPGYLYMGGLFVEPAFRGKGVGRAFIRWLTDRARELGREGIVWCCLQKNRPALAFSERVGATDCGERTFVSQGVAVSIRVYAKPLKC